MLSVIGLGLDHRLLAKDYDLSVAKSSTLVPDQV